jgi:hypothetical protein
VEGLLLLIDSIFIWLLMYRLNKINGDLGLLSYKEDLIVDKKE